MVSNEPEVYSVEWPTRREPVFLAPAQILVDREIRDMPAKASQNLTQQGAAPPFVMSDRNASRRCAVLNSSVLRPLPSPPACDVPAPLIVVKPFVVEKQPYNGEGGRHE